jgi:hypothetical protein
MITQYQQQINSLKIELERAQVALKSKSEECASINFRFQQLLTEKDPTRNVAASNKEIERLTGILNKLNGDYSDSRMRLQQATEENNTVKRRLQELGLTLENERKMRGSSSDQRLNSINDENEKLRKRLMDIENKAALVSQEV